MNPVGTSDSKKYYVVTEENKKVKWDERAGNNPKNKPDTAIKTLTTIESFFAKNVNFTSGDLTKLSEISKAVKTGYIQRVTEKKASKRNCVTRFFFNFFFNKEERVNEIDAKIQRMITTRQKHIDDAKKLKYLGDDDRGAIDYQKKLINELNTLIEQLDNQHNTTLQKYYSENETHISGSRQFRLVKKIDKDETLQRIATYLTQDDYQEICNLLPPELNNILKTRPPTPQKPFKPLHQSVRASINDWVIVFPQSKEIDWRAIDLTRSREAIIEKINQTLQPTPVFIMKGENEFVCE